jgi:hypothetical protein
MITAYFLRFLPIYGGKIGVFLNNQCYDQVFAKKLAVVSEKSANKIAKIFGKSIF